MSVNTKTVVQLKSLAKSRGLTGYSKLRKNELINILTQKAAPVVSKTVPALMKPVRNALLQGLINSGKVVKDLVTDTYKRTTETGKKMVSNFIDSGKKIVKTLPKNIPDGLQSMKKGVTKIINFFQSNKKQIEDVIDEEQKSRPA